MIRIWTDGACSGNPGPCAYGVLVIDGDGNHHVLGGFIGHGTSNIAEYTGMLAALDWLDEHGRYEKAIIHTDSQLVAFRLNGAWKKKRSHVPHIQKLIEQARSFLSVLPHVEIKWVPREKNWAADEIAARYL